MGVRRLRSAFALFRRVLPRADIDPLSAELRWLAGELGPARDLDVFLERLALERDSSPHQTELSRLEEEARSLREECYLRVRDALDSARFTSLALQLGAWRVRCGWRNQRLGPVSAQLFSSARLSLAPLLEKRQSRVRRAGRQLAQRAPAELHALRLRVKRLRYGTEFARSVYGGAATPYGRSLSRLQDVLGHLNDVATAQRLLNVLLAGFHAGWVARGAQVELASLGAAWRRFRRAEPFWRAG